MASEIVTRILQRINRPDLRKVLAEDLSGSELNSLLLEVFAERTRSRSAPDLLNRYQENRFSKPADLPVIEMKQMELDILHLCKQYSFEPIELSPVNVLGSCSVVAPADQKNILTALRGTEVLADSTNAIALYVSDLKQKKVLTDRVARLCSIQRMVRTQSITQKGFTPHFRAGCLVSCGADQGNFGFEKDALNEHVRLMKVLFLDYYKMDEISFRLIRREGYPSEFLNEIVDFLRTQNPNTVIKNIEKPAKNINYYKGIQYKGDIVFKGKTYEIIDGGFVDWTQQLLQNKKERMLSTGFGFDFMYRILRDRL